MNRVARHRVNYFLLPDPARPTVRPSTKVSSYLSGVALGRKACLFACSDRGSERTAAMYSLIITAKLSEVDPRA